MYSRIPFPGKILSEYLACFPAAQSLNLFVTQAAQQFLRQPRPIIAAAADGGG